MMKRDELPVSPANSVNICGVRIDNLSFDEAVERILKLARREGSDFVVTPNVDHVVKLSRLAELRSVYSRASLVLADGMPLLWAAKFLGTPLLAKVSGSDLFFPVCQGASQNGLSVYLLGGDVGVADRAAAKLESDVPGIKVAGTYCPPYGFEHDPAELSRIDSAIVAAKPDILFVGLGAPKQEYWMAKKCEALKVPVTVGIGITFSLYTGDVPRAPVFWQKSGFEWAWRLWSEPKRLWRRYLVEDPVFFWYVLLQKLVGKEVVTIDQ